MSGIVIVHFNFLFSFIHFETLNLFVNRLAFRVLTDINCIN